MSPGGELLVGAVLDQPALIQHEHVVEVARPFGVLQRPEDAFAGKVFEQRAADQRLLARIEGGEWVVERFEILSSDNEKLVLRRAPR